MVKGYVHTPITYSSQAASFATSMLIPMNKHADQEETSITAQTFTVPSRPFTSGRHVGQI